jgi:hypothetical protein
VPTAKQVRARAAERELGAKIFWIEEPPDLIKGAIY